MKTDCLFCKIIAGDIPATMRYQDEFVVAFEDVEPKAPTHILIVPKKHITTVLDLTAGDNDLVGHIYQVANQLAKEEGIEKDGFRIVNNCNEAGGQSVWHIHFHLLGGRQMEWPPG